MPNGGSTHRGFFPCRTDELDAVNKLNEWAKLVLGGTILSAKQLLKEMDEKIFALAEDRFKN